LCCFSSRRIFQSTSQRTTPPMNTGLEEEIGK